MSLIIHDLNYFSSDRSRPVATKPVFCSLPLTRGRDSPPATPFTSFQIYPNKSGLNIFTYCHINGEAGGGEGAV